MFLSLWFLFASFREKSAPESLTVRVDLIDGELVIVIIMDVSVTKDDFFLD